MRMAMASGAISMMFALSACGSDPIREVPQHATYPAIGVVETRGVGEPLISLYSGILVPHINILDDAMIGGDRVAKGHYDYYDENSKGVWFGPDAFFFLRKSDGHICIEETNACALVEHTMEKRLSQLDPDSFQQTLLYNGKIGSRITLGYREFSDNIARPAFNNDVDYDLAESMVVGYKGARLEVIKASNTEIVYKLLSGFSD